MSPTVSFLCFCNFFTIRTVASSAANFGRPLARPRATAVASPTLVRSPLVYLFMSTTPCRTEVIILQSLALKLIFWLTETTRSDLSHPSMRTFNQSRALSESRSRRQTTTARTFPPRTSACKASYFGRRSLAVGLSMYHRTLFGLMRLLLSQRLIYRLCSAWFFSTVDTRM